MTGTKIKRTRLSRGAVVLTIKVDYIFCTYLGAHYEIASSKYGGANEENNEVFSSCLLSLLSSVLLASCLYY